MRLPISVFIIAQNEGDRIATTIASVKDWVQEVIVVDSGSGDNTVEVAEALGARTFFHPWQGYGLQKRFAEDQCSQRWLMNLDADEEVTPALAAEIAALFASGLPAQAGYILRIRDLLPGEAQLAPMAHTNFVLRLYDRECGRFSDSPVHDSVILTRGRAVMLQAPVLHRSFRNVSHAIEKMNSYTGAQARDMHARGKKAPGSARLLLEFPFAFLKVYVLRGYALRGRRGFIYAMHYAFGRFMRLAKYVELKNKL